MEAGDDRPLWLSHDWKGNLARDRLICERGWGGLEGSRLGRLIIEEKMLGKRRGCDEREMRWRDNPGSGGVSLEGNYQCEKQQRALLPLVRRAIEFHALSNQESGLKETRVTSALQLPTYPSVPPVLYLSGRWKDDPVLFLGLEGTCEDPKVLDHAWIMPSKHLTRGPQKNVVTEYLPSSLGFWTVRACEASPGSV